MTTMFLRVSPRWTFAAMMLAGCSSSAPPDPVAGPPPPPPAKVLEPKPEPPPAKPQPDPYAAAMSEVGTIVKRYGTIYTNIKDEVTANKAVEEISQMTARLRELAVEIGKLPYQAGVEQHTLALQAELTQMQAAQLSNPDMQRVLGDLDLGLKFIAAHQSFVTEGLLPLGQALVAKQPPVQQRPAPPEVPPSSPSTK